MNNLLTIAGSYLNVDGMVLVKDAYDFAQEAHHGQKRLSGEPYFEHPVDTAVFLANLHMDETTLAGALLHDVVENCNVTLKDLDNRFGNEVMLLVDGVTKLRNIDFTSSSDQNTTAKNRQAENLRKMLLAMAKDIRVVLIKLADRLHNMKTLGAHAPDKQITIARETLDIYAPLAHRLGMWDIKWRLEDMSFNYLDPEEYDRISGLVSTKREKREMYVDQIRTVITEELKKAGIEAEISGRPKHIYSIHNKIQKYAKSEKEFGEIYDLFALRVLVNEIQDCYHALGVIHGLWHPIPSEFDDYIANPKDNMYQSLHTSVMYEWNIPIEIQIRTHDMHHISEYGIAAHWRYKESNRKDIHFEEKIGWFRQLLEWQREVMEAEEFLESVKMDIFQDQVFVYTPKGDVLELPTSSTPIDFAYRVHTDLGHRCIGSKVNGKLVPLYTRLNNGDKIEVVTSKVAKGPSLDWLNSNLGYANTANARSKIRLWFRKQERGTNINRGRELLTKELRRLNLRISENEIAKVAKISNGMELLASLGNGTVSIAQISAKLAANQDDIQDVPIHNLTWPTSGISVLGVGDLLTRISRCCGPIPGDQIIGYITRSRGVSVHRSDCLNISHEDEIERIVEVNWGANHILYPVRLRIEALDRVGLLRDITTLVSQEKVNIASVVTTEEEDSSCSINLTLFTAGVGQLNRLFSRIEGIDGVFSVVRDIPKEDAVQYTNKNSIKPRGITNVQ